MNPDENTTAPPAGGDTPAAATQPPATPSSAPGPVPYERFKELVDARKAEAERNNALTATVQALQKTIDERLPKKEEPAESAWEDPAEKALKEVEALKTSHASVVDALGRQAASAAIDKAVSTRSFADADEVKERLAERWYLARAHGNAFDAEAEATALFQKETRRRESDRAAWVVEKDQAAAATRSAASAGPSPPPGEPPAAPPPWGTPEREKWENEGPGSTAAILREFRG